MLQITIPEVELYDEERAEFSFKKEIVLSLEHSLISISKWESKWHKPFLTSEKNEDEILDYIICMSVGKRITPADLEGITKEDLEAINNYIDDPMTATTFSSGSTSGQTKFVTSELVYYWMAKASIPFECEKWHFNRLMTLIRVCMEEDNTKKEMSPDEIMRQNRELNEKRRREMHTNG